MKKQIDKKLAIWGLIVISLSSVAGTLAVQQLNPSYLKKILPFLMIFILLIVSLKKDFGLKEKKEVISEKYIIIFFGIINCF